MSNDLDSKADIERASYTEDVSPSRKEADDVSTAQTTSNVRRARSRGLVPPAIIANLTQEQRTELEARLRRKIDFRLLPMIILMYIMNYLDRNNIASAKLAGIEAALHLPTSSDQYQVGENLPLDA
jgi:hypothetical protein